MEAEYQEAGGCKVQKLSCVFQEVGRMSSQRSSLMEIKYRGGETRISGQYSGPWGSPGGTSGKECRRHWSHGVRSLGQEDPLEKGMATHSGILAWGIPGTEEPGGLQSMGLH